MKVDEPYKDSWTERMAQPRPSTTDAFVRRLNHEVVRVCGERGIRQGALADPLGVSENTLSSWLNGRSSPGLAHLIQLADVLSVGIEELTGSQRSHDSHRLAKHRQACESLVRQLASLDLGVAADPTTKLGPALEDLGSATPDLLAVLKRAQDVVAALDSSAAM
jgi:transcriptional regulator with XRE-family HTH domain